jgi:hypothetical protein
MPITNHRLSELEHASSQPSPAEVEADFWRELQEIEAESIGWTELDASAYLHTTFVEGPFVEIVGIASASMAADNVLWLL